MDIFTALADPTRRQMLDRLLAREHAAGELVDAFPELSQPAVSRHLRVLREAGFIQMRVDAQRRLYSLRPDAFEELTSWLARYRQFWPQALDALEKHLNATRPETTQTTKQPGRKRPGNTENRK